MFLTKGQNFDTYNGGVGNLFTTWMLFKKLDFFLSGLPRMINLTQAQ